MTEMKYKREDGTFGDIILGPSNGGTGQTALVGNPSLLQTLFSDPKEDYNFIPCFNDLWQSAGYFTRQQLRNTIGLGNTLGAVPVANGGTGATTAANARTNLGAAAASHNHAASAINSGTLALARGGTGASLSAAPSMLTNLGSTTAASIFAATPRPGITGTLAVGHGGTGATTAANARTNLGITAAGTASYYVTHCSHQFWGRDAGGVQRYFYCVKFSNHVGICGLQYRVSLGGENKAWGNIYYWDSLSGGGPYPSVMNFQGSAVNIITLSSDSGSVFPLIQGDDNPTHYSTFWVADGSYKSSAPAVWANIIAIGNVN